MCILEGARLLLVKFLYLEYKGFSLEHFIVVGVYHTDYEQVWSENANWENEGFQKINSEYLRVGYANEETRLELNDILKSYIDVNNAFFTLDKIIDSDIVLGTYSSNNNNVLITYAGLARLTGNTLEFVQANLEECYDSIDKILYSHNTPKIIKGKNVIISGVISYDIAKVYDYIVDDGVLQFEENFLLPLEKLNDLELTHRPYLISSEEDELLEVLSILKYVSLAVGVLFLVIAMLILINFNQMDIEENSHNIKTLYLSGFSKSTINAYYIMNGIFMVLISFGIFLVTLFPLLFVVREFTFEYMPIPHILFIISFGGVMLPLLFNIVLSVGSFIFSKIKLKKIMRITND